jgi:hypothetical protein
MFPQICACKIQWTMSQREFIKSKSFVVLDLATLCYLALLRVANPTIKFLDLHLALWIPKWKRFVNTKFCTAILSDHLEPKWWLKWGKQVLCMRLLTPKHTLDGVRDCYETIQSIFHHDYATQFTCQFTTHHPSLYKMGSQVLTLKVQ